MLDYFPSSSISPRSLPISLFCSVFFPYVFGLFARAILLLHMNEKSRKKSNKKIRRLVAFPLTHTQKTKEKHTPYTAKCDKARDTYKYVIERKREPEKRVSTRFSC